MLYENKRLDKSVCVEACNRPIKIAYLVPDQDNDETSLILDAVFFESYTRWGGVNTLIIPTSANKFLYPIQEE